MRAEYVVIAMLWACAPPPTTERLSPLPPLAPLAPPPLITDELIVDALFLPSGELERIDSQLVAVRLGDARRQARVVRVPAKARTRVPPGVAAVRLHLGDPFAAAAAPGCRIEMKVAWDTTDESAALALEAKPRPEAWHRIQLNAQPRATPSTLEVTLSPRDCGDGASVLVAHSEVTPFGRTSAPDARPNVIMLVLDTLRRDHLDCAKESLTLAPNLTRLCSRGVFFSNAYSAASWTYPSLASMFTGFWPREHDAVRLQGKQHYLRRQVPMLAELLRDAGYTTLGVIPNPWASNGLSRGFDEFIELYRRNWRDDDARRADNVVATMRKLMTARASTPYFLYALFVDVHEPVDAVRKTGEKLSECAGVDPIPYGWQGMTKPSATPSAEDLARLRCRKALYKAGLRYLDRELGKLLDELETGPLADNTAIFVVADHGEELWDHAAEQARTKADASRWGVDHGATMYDEVTHVPLLIVPPGGAGARAGTHEPTLVSSADLFATILAMTSTPVPAHNPSRDLGWLFEGRDGVGRPFVVTDTTLYGLDMTAVTTPRLRAISTGAGIVEVFDRQADPGEKRPLPRNHPDFIEGDALVRRLGKRPPKAKPQAEVEALRALGYVE